MSKSTNIYCLTDYKNIFGSKFDAVPYRSGYDKAALTQLFSTYKLNAVFINASQVNIFSNNWKEKLVLYTSSEEYKLLYKNFIEDIVYGLKAAGAILIPEPAFLRANNNKVFMEIASQALLPKHLQTLPGMYFGSYDELKNFISTSNIKYPCVLKASAGAKSRGVHLAENETALLAKAKKLSNTFSPKIHIKEFIRTKLHKGYMPESAYLGKFIIQPFVPGLKNDWKVLIYGEKYFILKRSVRVNDFRASGSGIDYKSGSASEFPMEMLNFVREYFLAMDIPNLSIDFGYDGEKGYIFEYQAIHYGTYTQQKSIDYYEFIENKWELRQNNCTNEEVYVYSIAEYLKRKKLLT
jgi:hypothetical protein